VICQELVGVAVMTDTSVVSEAVIGLKNLIRALNAHGLTYGKIISELDGVIDWTEGSLKQFVYREGASRKTKNVEKVAEFVGNYIINHPELLEIDPEIKDNYAKLKYIGFQEVKSKRGNELGYARNFVTILDEQLKYLQRIPIDVYFADDYIFIRYNADKTKIQIIKLHIFTYDRNKYFFMRISGQDRKRLIVGKILSTIANTHFMGVALGVNQEMHEFESQDFFDSILSEQNLSRNAIGIEMLNFPNTSISEVYFPVTFCGLDSRGRPLVGRGIIVNSAAASTLGIDNPEVSSIACTKASPILSGKLSSVDAFTKPIEEYDLSKLNK
jgi:hypothetical protein